MREACLVLIILCLGYESIARPLMEWGNAATSGAEFVAGKSGHTSIVPYSNIIRPGGSRFSEVKVSRQGDGGNTINAAGLSAEFQSPVQPAIDPSFRTSKGITNNMIMSQADAKPLIYYQPGGWDRLDNSHDAYEDSLADDVSKVIQDEKLKSKLRNLLSEKGVPNRFHSRGVYETEISGKAEELLKQIADPTISLPEKTVVFMVMDRTALAQQAFGESLISLVKGREDYQDAMMKYLYNIHEMSRPGYSWTFRSLNAASTSRRRTGFIFGLMNDLELREAFERNFLITKFSSLEQSATLEAVSAALKNLPNRWYESSESEKATHLRQQAQAAAFELIQRMTPSEPKVQSLDGNFNAAYEVLRHLSYYDRSSFESIFHTLQKAHQNDDHRLQQWIFGLQQNHFYATESQLIQNMDVQGDVFGTLPVELRRYSQLESSSPQAHSSIMPHTIPGGPSAQEPTRAPELLSMRSQDITRKD